MEKFDYKSYAQNTKEQLKEFLSDDINSDTQQYILDTIFNFLILAGESLDSEDTYTEEQKELVCQYIAEQTFHKANALIQANVEQELWEPTLRKVAFLVFELVKQGFKEHLEQNEILNNIEEVVQKAFSEDLDGSSIPKEKYTPDSESQQKPDEIYKVSENDKLGLQVGYGLLKIADPERGGQLPSKIKALRENLKREFGYEIPPVRVFDSISLKENEYIILVNGNTVEYGYVHPDKVTTNVAYDVIIEHLKATMLKYINKIL